MVNIIVDGSKCTGCGTCKNICPAGVFVVRADKAVPANVSACMECHACEYQCTQSAISFSEGPLAPKCKSAAKKPAKPRSKKK